MSIRTFVIVGASGNVGRELAPRLMEAGYEVVVVGRDLAKLQAAFPGANVAGYDDIGKVGGADCALLYLTTINNDEDAPYDLFRAVNVELAIKVRDQAAQAGMGQFVYFSSTHALDERNLSHYALSKRAAVAAMRQISVPIDTRVIYLPAVIGERLSGRLSILNQLPAFIYRPLLSILRALKPTVLISDIVDSLLRMDDQNDDDLIVSSDQSANLFFAFSKRVIDIASAAGILLLLWWLMLVIWVMVKVQSPGPGVFSQTRIGQHGRPFTCYKFRTMYVSAPNVATHEAPASAVTPLGRFLRGSKLDELPQVFNILANQMSLVGPRPCLPSQVDLIAERRERGVLDMKPGITGLAQVNGIDMSDAKRLAKWDARYLRLRSISLDLKLIIQTGLGRGRGGKVR